MTATDAGPLARIRPGPEPGEPPARKTVSPVAIITGVLFVLWAPYKLHKSGYF